MKQLEVKPNDAGGLDLMVERDAGNLVRILTGKNSLKFFKELKDLCDGAINSLETPKSEPKPTETYKVVWEIELNADSPLAAAKEAQRWMQSRGDNWQFYVQKDGTDEPIYSVDLQEEDDDASLKVTKGEYQPMIRG